MTRRSNRQLAVSFVLIASTMLAAPCLTLADSHGAAAEATADSTEPAKKPTQQGGDVAINAIDEFIATQKIDKTASGWKTRLTKPPQVEFAKDKTYYWNMKTNVGDIKIKLLPDTAPMHVSSTIYLTRLGFYDDVIFHRVINGFMAQGGDPLGQGYGGPGYKYAGEYSDSVRHDKPGLLSMANSGPGTDGSQFFLTFVPTPHLDGKHTIFGEVVEGMDTVRALEQRGSRSGRTSEKLLIEKATISVE
jgi:peptidyl-prolyl cis-trans isomerase B (cyclophilin B)